MSVEPLSDYQITQAMIVFGGDFANAIGNAFRRADADNQRTLKQAFDGLWVEFSDPRMHERLAKIEARG